MYKQILLQVCIIGAFFALQAASQGPVNQPCLGCLCEAISGCNATKVCQGDVCGPFRITWAYWADSGKPTLNGESDESPTAYSNCASDIYCSALAVQGYMDKFQKDCNGDAKIDCDDFVQIHILGGYGCAGNLPQAHHDRYHQCKRIVGNSN
ncbi:lysozyme-like [Atheta coriaria]|uniref:lysozyme-like n=1 Tax=Dalotia coriaria TaxID=877792 RepID=UPI0031F3BCBF